MNFTKPIIEKLECNDDAKPSFYWDSSTSGFGVKVTPQNKKTYIFQGRVGTTTRRITIGQVKDLRLSDAREKAKELAVMCTQGIDPKVEKNKRIQSDQLLLKEEKRKSTKFHEVWLLYLSENKNKWRERTYEDHLKLSQGGFCPVKNFHYKPQPIYELLDKKMCELDKELLSTWLLSNDFRQTSASKSYRLVRAFLNWCQEDDRFTDMAPKDAIKSKKVKDKVKAVQPRDDVLEEEHLSSWFKEVKSINNPKLSAFYICCLLTGARKEELLSLKWENIDFTWRTIHLADKVDDNGREIPMTNYVEKILTNLKQNNSSEFVFSSDTSSTGYIVNPYKEFKKICAKLDIALTLHGLRRSYKTFSDELGISAGVTAQNQGHKPSALIERHYVKRTMNTRRKFYQKYENWILKKAKITV